MDKIRVLITNVDQHGVNFYRSEQPAIQLSKQYPDDFDVEYNKFVNWDDLEYLKQFDIIHGHRSFCDFDRMPDLIKLMKENNIKTILDIDDYWEVSKEHPLYFQIKKDNMKDKIVGNLKLVDAVTTTGPVYKSYIEKYNKNVFIIPNGVNRNLKEFKPSTDKCSYDKLRIMYLAGSSHLQDVNLLKDGFEVLINDTNVKDKFQIHLTGFDLRGTTTNYILNEEFIKDLQMRGLFKPDLHKKLIKHEFKIHDNLFNEIPQDIKDKYPNGVITEETRPIKPSETVWTRYEEIFTSNYKLVNDPEYLEYLKKYDLELKFDNLENQNYIRHKTQGLYKFAENYKYADVALAPIKVYGNIKHGIFEDNTDNRYQFAKSNLKIIEAAFHKVPVIASNVPIYNWDKDWIDGYNIIYVNPERQYKDWYKKMKWCINNPDAVKEMGERAYETAVKKYDLEVLSEQRAEIYRTVMKEVELV